MPQLAPATTALFAALFGCACASSSPQASQATAPSEAPGASSTPDARLERFVALEGSWARVDESGAATDELIATYSATAGGSAVVETLFPGAPQEMTSVFHLEGGTLALTHYCMLGNHPFLMAAPGAPEAPVEFTCTGMSPESQPHMHAATFTWLGTDRLRTRWVQHAGGEQAEEVVFELIRVVG